MSYSRQYTGKVSYSGSVSYRYPASEHGGVGSKTFHVDVPVTCEIRVDTDPFDQSVEGTKKALTGVAAAVGVFESAHIAAIRELGKKVSDTAVKGFFKLIGNDISQEISQNKSAIQSDMALLMEQKNAIEAIHAQMESDFKRIGSRYRSIFHTLDEECRKRILEVDRPAFELKERTGKKLLNQSFLCGAPVFLEGMTELNACALSVTGARLKRKVGDTLSALLGRIQTQEQYRQDRKMICAGEQCAEVSDVFVPVLYVCSGANGEPEHSMFQYYYRQFSESKKEIEEAVKERVEQSREESWDSLADEEKALLDRFFTQEAERYLQEKQENGADHARIYRELMKLYREADVKTLA